MNVTTTLSTADDAYIIKNMYPLYLHDLSEFSGEGPNEHGIVEPSAVRTLAEQGDVQSIWWERPGKLFPFTILANGRAAGFALVAGPPHASTDVDYIMQEFSFCMHFAALASESTPHPAYLIVFLVDGKLVCCL